jgi:hypothetical protein
VCPKLLYLIAFDSSSGGRRWPCACRKLHPIPGKGSTPRCARCTGKHRRPSSRPRSLTGVNSTRRTHRQTDRRRRRGSPVWPRYRQSAVSVPPGAFPPAPEPNQPQAATRAARPGTLPVHQRPREIVLLVPRPRPAHCGATRHRRYRCLPVPQPATGMASDPIPRRHHPTRPTIPAITGGSERVQIGAQLF